MTEVEALPGVSSGAMARFRPISHGRAGGSIRVVGEAAPGAPQMGETNIVTPSFFETMQMPLLRGRALGEADSELAPRVAVVNETMARQVFGGAALGRRIQVTGRPEDLFEIVGIVGDAKYHTLREQTPPMVYLGHRQVNPDRLNRMHFVVRTSRRPEDLARAVRAAVARAAPEALVVQMNSFEQQLDDSLMRERLIATLSGFFGILALILACIGLYGLISYRVVRRTREIGIRVAVGADSGAILWMVMRDVLGAVAAGLAVGLVAALNLSRFVSTLLFGVVPNDLRTVVLAVAALVGAAFLATYVPARRVLALDPLRALRTE